MDFLEQIFKKSDKPAPKTRAVSKASEIAPPPARTIAIAKETTPPPSKSKVQVLAQPKAMEIHFHESEFSVPPKKRMLPWLGRNRTSHPWKEAVYRYNANGTSRHRFVRKMLPNLSIRWRASVMKSGLEIIPAQIEK